MVGVVDVGEMGRVEVHVRRGLDVCGFMGGLSVEGAGWVVSHRRGWRAHQKFDGHAHRKFVRRTPSNLLRACPRPQQQKKRKTQQTKLTPHC